MIEVYYERNGVDDLRSFRDLEELNLWLQFMFELCEIYFIKKITKLEL